MKKNHALLVAVSLFKMYPTVNTFHITKDKQAFENKHNAEAHALSLDKENPTVISVNRDEEQEEEVVEPTVLEIAKRLVEQSALEVETATDTFNKAKPAKKEAAETALALANENLNKAMDAFKALQA